MIPNPISYISDLIKIIKSGALASIRAQRALESIRREAFFNHFSKTDRFSDPKRLFRGAFKVFSEATEDGMIHEVFSRIGTDAKRFVEIGVADGLECNTAFLLTQGWAGAWIDSSVEAVAKARRTFKDFPLTIICETVTPENADPLVRECSHGQAIDLLSVDIDSHDYYIWEAINCIQPRVVVIEYNSSLPPHVSQTIVYSTDPHPPVGTIYFGASLQALVKLAAKKHYSLVGCSITGVNAFFVRNDLLGQHFREPFTAENHYEPPRYGLIGPAGHAPGVGKWMSV